MAGATEDQLGDRRDDLLWLHSLGPASVCLAGSTRSVPYPSSCPRHRMKLMSVTFVIGIMEFFVSMMPLVIMIVCR
jgi:hypothetical protein